ncbi:MAG: S46 family peptidase [Niabella sp.]
MFKRLLQFTVFFLVSVVFCRADEGMWLPQLLEQLNEPRMKNLGMKISAKDIYDVNKGSLKDAVVSFGGFCTGEVVSDQGLVLTNHHCGFSAIQSHSTIDNNFIRNGFWAMDKNQELPNTGLFVTFIVRIEDVTDAVLKGVASNMAESERQSQIDKNIKALGRTAQREPYQDGFVRGFFEANKYYMFITETYNDVRLVGAPPAAIGNFGQDSDNWMWPRHTGDFSVFRIYADKNNKPAAYSSDNVPYKPKKSLTISLKGLKEDDFTMIFGFPGKTTEYLPSEAVNQIVNNNDPAKILVRDRALAILNKYMRADEGIKIQYASKYAGISNAWKKWQGEVLGLTRTNAVEKKLDYEKSFTQRLDKNATLKAQYGIVLADLNKAYKEIKPYTLARDYYLELTSKVELFTIVNRMNALKQAFIKRATVNYPDALKKERERTEIFYKDFNKKVDEEIFAAMLQIYMENQDAAYINPFVLQEFEKYGKDYKAWAAYMYSTSVFVDDKKMKGLLADSPEKMYELLLTDPAAKLLDNMNDFYNHKVVSNLDKIQPRINDLQRRYMQAQMDVFSDKVFYPDANSTLRVAFGNVKGYQAADAKNYYYYTFLDGVMEKYKPGDYEFDVPEKLRQLYKNKDYGQYGVNGKMPVCFIAMNHTTGGNSGSPALDAYGNLVGINFDRVWEGTMSDINYDASICRNIMVDIRYVLFVIDKYANAGHLIKEMNVVYAKK